MFPLASFSGSDTIYDSKCSDYDFTVSLCASGFGVLVEFSLIASSTAHSDHYLNVSIYTLDIPDSILPATKLGLL